MRDSDAWTVGMGWVFKYLTNNFFYLILFLFLIIVSTFFIRKIGFFALVFDYPPSNYDFKSLFGGF